MQSLRLTEGWHILQDVHDRGEMMKIYELDWSAQQRGHCISEWEPIDRLGHLQMLLADSPYFGRELRHFNQAPWWYRNDFELGQNDTKDCLVQLRFEAVDYFCRVWLNGCYLGEHEGYFAPFEFDVSECIRPGVNTLIVKVWSPWDEQVLEGVQHRRHWAVIRDLVKGTYEHADTYIARDVNPVGIWGDVSLTIASDLTMKGTPWIDAHYDQIADEASVKTQYTVASGKEQQVTAAYSLRESATGRQINSWTKEVDLQSGDNTLTSDFRIASPSLWTTWDRGTVNLYDLEVSIHAAGEILDGFTRSFGVRCIELRRTAEETTVILNGQPLFIRGTSYFPDVYVSNLYYERYQRDLELIQAAGFNAIRVHVHVEKPELYELCDEMGIAVIQDSDLNWLHPTDTRWQERALEVFQDMIVMLRNHPAIIAWVAINEPDGDRGAAGDLMTVSPGPQLYAAAKRLDPGRPIIKGSWCNNDVLSGDSHNYTGSLSGNHTHYLDILSAEADTEETMSEKFNTEFGVDAPAGPHNLRTVPRIYKRIHKIRDDIPAIQYYQYRLLKFYIDRYRLRKYQPCSGYFQFMFIDLCPQSFYGVYDWWGIPKKGADALRESNQPLALIFEHDTKPQAIWVVNDYDDGLTGCRLQWSVVDGKGQVVAEGTEKLDVQPDSIAKVRDLSFEPIEDQVYTVAMTLLDSAGDRLAGNLYHDPFHHPAHPQDHPDRMSHEIGMRLFHA